MRTTPAVFPSVKRSMSFLSGLIAGTLLLSGASALAATPNYATFQTTLNATGTMSPDASTISFPLFRQDLSTLTISLNGTTSFPITAESAASGYIGIKEVSTSPAVFFITGAFPALTSELPALEAKLQAANLPITAIVNSTAGLSQSVVTVHVEATMTETQAKLATVLADVLQDIHNPQMNVHAVVVPPTYPAGSIPAKFIALMNKGEFVVLDGNTVLFSAPREDKVAIKIGDGVEATPSLGVGQSIFISGEGYGVLNIELALGPNQVSKVSAILSAAGFTLASQSDYFVDDTKRLTFLRATAVASDLTTFESQAEQLGKALILVK